MADWSWSREETFTVAAKRGEAVVRAARRRAGRVGVRGMSSP
jgi:hypothetical protein